MNEMAARFAQDFLTKRAGRACLSCRSRKIRCNVEDSGPPCSNCLTDDIDCVTAKSKRGKKPYRRLKNNPRRSGTKDGNTAEDILAPVKPNANVQRQTVPLSKVSPTHTAGWLDDSVELDVLSQCHVEGMYTIIITPLCMFPDHGLQFSLKQQLQNVLLPN
jgi:hypothetical protein